MLTSNKLPSDILINKDEVEEREVPDGKGGKMTVLVRKTKLKAITTKHINPGVLTAKGTPQKNYYPPLKTSDVPFPESPAARKKRMEAIERELDKKRLADGVEPVLKKKAGASKKDEPKKGGDG